ncbi:MAG: HAMP domain-containing histidine kinase, partial [Chitinophagaceae bacterium]|nr:HAMP domain-containing histidine kinase [Chitinophagaceae bacterium]
RFVSMASHEFRTPLSTILSSTALLRKYTLTEDQDKREKHLLKIKDSVKHLNELLVDFLSLGKLEEGKIKFNPHRFNAREFIQEVCDEMKPTLKRGQNIQHAYRGGANFCNDKRLLKNILINLLSNAIKFSPAGEMIGVDVYHRDGNLEVEVSDMGVGIPAEDMQHLFSTFFRGKNVTNIEGTGLGLNIVKRYTDLMQGTISVSSKEQQGTIFHLSLPEIVTEDSTY